MGFQHPVITEHPTPDPRVRLFRSAPEVDCFAVVTEHFLAVVDTFSTPEEAIQMMQLLDAERAGRSLLVINTHQHYDHAWGNRIFAADGPFPAPIIAQAHCFAELSSPEFQEAWEKAAQEPRFASVRVIPPTITFQHSLTLHGGDLTLELRPAPGHAPDQLVVWIPERRFLLAADALEHPWPSAETPQTLAQLVQTMHDLKSLDPQAILPCHGGTQDAALLERNLAYFANVRAQVEQSAIPDGWASAPDLAQQLYPMSEALADLGLSQTDGNPFYADLHQKNLRATIASLEEDQQA